LLRRLQFDLWYFLHPPWDSGISPPELFAFIEGHPAGRAIDIGCGSGTNVVTLARNGWQVTGIDYAARAIQLSKRKVRAAQVAATLMVCDVNRMPEIPESFDLALDLGCFHGLADHAPYLIGLDRLLRPGGYWLLYGFINDTPVRSGAGLDTATLDLIESHGLVLQSREDGTDKRGRPSAWLLYQRPAQNGRPGRI
jgi:SAM-dependent methyltransferase